MTKPRRSLTRFWTMLLISGLMLAAMPAHADGVVRGYILTQLSDSLGMSDLLQVLHGDGEDEEAHVLEQVPNTRIYALIVPPGESEASYARRVRSVSGVSYAESDTYFGDPKSLPFGFVSSTTNGQQIGDFIAQRASVDQMLSAGVTTRDYVWQPALGQIGFGRVALAEPGKGVKVAVLDTGVTPEHPTLYGRCTQGYNALNAELPALDIRDGTTNVATGHGTMVASLIARIAPDADIVPVRVLNGDGLGTGLSVAKGIVFSVGEGAKVLNMSFSSATPSKTLSAVIALAVQHGAVPVASAGNDGVRAPRWPAACYGVIGVASLESDNQLSSFSNFGAHVSVCAPGRNLFGAHFDGGYARWSGTSFAAPLVSAQATLLAALRPSASGAQIVSRIRGTARRVDSVNPLYASLLGAGLVNLPASLW